MLAALDDLDADVAVGGVRPGAGRRGRAHAPWSAGLLERAGADLGGRLRAGRSRNDQIATLIRMYLREQARALAGRLAELVGGAGRPGRAAPGRADAGPHPPAARPADPARRTTCWRTCWALLRDVDRLRDWDARAAVSPYGSGALAGSSLGPGPGGGGGRAGLRLGRPRTRWTPPPSRDVVAEFGFVTAMIGGATCPGSAEEVILWATKEFSFVTLDDAYSTGSSIMPQKKNPDVAELARGKAGRLIGNLAGLLATLKGLPLAYNRDLQEDKEPVFDSDRHPAAAAAGADRHGGHPGLRHRPAGVAGPARASRWPPTWPSGWSGRACRSGWRTSWRGSASGSARRTGIELVELSDADFAAISPHLTPGGARGADGGRLAGQPVGARRHRTGPGRRAACRSCAARLTGHRDWAGGRLGRLTSVSIDRELLARPALQVAPALLGATLVSSIGGAEVAVRITEVEAYEGALDPASHAFRGPTKRNAVMFGEAGRLYCYFVYGMHWCANIDLRAAGHGRRGAAAGRPRSSTGEPVAQGRTAHPAAPGEAGQRPGPAGPGAGPDRRAHRPGPARSALAGAADRAGGAGRAPRRSAGRGGGGCRAPVAVLAAGRAQRVGLPPGWPEAGCRHPADWGVVSMPPHASDPAGRCDASRPDLVAAAGAAPGLPGAGRRRGPDPARAGAGRAAAGRPPRAGRCG